MLTTNGRADTVPATGDLVRESAALAAGSYDDSVTTAGWTGLDLGAAAPAGVDRETVFQGWPPTDPATAIDITSTLQIATKVVDGKETLALAFRGTDQGASEFAFQAYQFAPGVYGWDLYIQAHQAAIKAALGYAAEPSNGIDQVLIAGHSLGGILAELTAERFLTAYGLEDKALITTFGSPGSTDSNGAGLEILNFLHSDDIIPLLGEISTAAAALHREGVDIRVDRPEGSLDLTLPPGMSKDTFEGLFLLTQKDGNKVEHAIELYQDTAATLVDNQHVVPGVATDGGDWLGYAANLAVLGTGGDDRLKGGAGSQVLVGRDGNDRIVAGTGNDGLSGGAGRDQLSGNGGDDRLDGGAGNDWVVGNAGKDVVVLSAGYDHVDGGTGCDTLVVGGDRHDFRVCVAKDHLVVKGAVDGAAATSIVSHVEHLTFEDGSYAVEHGHLVPLGDFIA